MSKDTALFPMKAAALATLLAWQSPPAAATNDATDNWVDNYVIAQGGCATYFQEPLNQSDLWSPKNGQGAVNEVGRSVQQGNIDVTLFGKTILEWTSDDVAAARHVFRDCAERMFRTGPSGANLAANMDLMQAQIEETIRNARKLDAERKAQHGTTEMPTGASRLSQASTKTGNWIENYVIAQGGCATYFQQPVNMPDLYSPKNGQGAINYVASSVQQGNIDVTLFGKKILEWTSEDVAATGRVFRDCAQRTSGLAGKINWLETQIKKTIGEAGKLSAERQEQQSRQQFRQQAELKNQAADEARGYRRISFETFMLDSRDLVTEAARVSLSGEYIRRGNQDVLYANKGAAMNATRGGMHPPEVPLLTEHAPRAFRKLLLSCQSDPGSTQFGCTVTVLGWITTCTWTAPFGRSREEPCLAVEDGRSSGVWAY